jgi:hypothetical protein
MHTNGNPRCCLQGRLAGTTYVSRASVAKKFAIYKSIVSRDTSVMRNRLIGKALYHGGNRALTPVSQKRSARNRAKKK